MLIAPCGRSLGSLQSNLACCDFDALDFATIPEFDWQRLARREAHPPNEVVFVMMQQLSGIVQSFRGT